MKFAGLNITRAVKSAPSQKSMALGTSQELGSFLMLGSQGRGTTPSSALNLYNQSSAVSIPINRIATAIADMKIVLEDDNGVITTSHPVLDLIRKPSPFYTSTLFMSVLAKNFMITGEMQVVGIGGLGRPPLELQPISPDLITVTKGQGGLAANIIVSGVTMPGSYLPIRNGLQVRYVRDDLSELHMTRNFQTQDNSLLRGQSLLVSASSEVRQHILGGVHNTSLLEKGGRVSLVFHFEQEMDDADFEVSKERVRAQYGGAQKAGEIGITAGDGALKIQDIGSKNKDMDFVKLQQMARIAIANQYGFPLILLDTDAATFNNYASAKEALYDDAALPIASVLLDGLTDFLMPRFGEDPSRVKLAIDMDSIPALTMRRNKELELRRKINVETVNELRESLPNRENITEGGDDVYIPANHIPIGSDPVEFDENPGMNAGGEDG